jgi:hypothetical protein
MRRSSVGRDIVGTLLMFLLLALFVVGLIFGENYLERFKAH